VKAEAWVTQAGEKLRSDRTAPRLTRKAEESTGRADTLNSLADFLLTNTF